MSVTPSDPIQESLTETNTEEEQTSSSVVAESNTLKEILEDQEPSRVDTIVKVCVLLWSATLLSLSYYEPPSGKKIVDFDPTFIASIFSASTASLGFQIKKKKDTIVDNKNSKVGIK